MGFEPTLTYARPVFKTGASTPQPLANSHLPEDTPNVSASCLALLNRKSPDLALLVERWDTLPEVVRAGIVAMVKATLKDVPAEQ